MAKFKRIWDYKLDHQVKVYPPKQVKQRTEEQGWLKLWWIAEMPGNEPPARRQYCTRREVAGIVKHWQAVCPLTLLKHEFVPDNATDALATILAPTSPLDRILRR